MASINRKELTDEMIHKAMKCRNADELLTLAKSEGYEIIEDEAQAYIEELSNFKLDDEMLEAVVGGVNVCYAIDGCCFKCGTLKDC